VFNCPDIEIGEDLREFRAETSEMSPVVSTPHPFTRKLLKRIQMKGLAISNCPLVQKVHNSLARPADIRAAFHQAAVVSLKSTTSTKTTTTTSATKLAESKRAEARQRQKAKVEEQQQTQQIETYHFIGYVPAHGKVWELDGLKSGPLEVGEIPHSEDMALATGAWMSIVRPALRMKMQRYGGDNIKFNLLALVPDRYEVASDELEMRRRERDALERRMKECFGETWENQVGS
jgi:ubiquitin carboxyl-terminal hydrolase L5